MTHDEGTKAIPVISRLLRGRVGLERSHGCEGECGQSCEAVDAERVWMGCLVLGVDLAARSGKWVGKGLDGQANGLQREYAILPLRTCEMVYFWDSVVNGESGSPRASLIALHLMLFST